MKKLIFLLLVLIFSTTPVLAKTIPVKALENFSTKNPPEEYSIEILEDVILDERFILKEGDILHGEIINVKSPKRLKRNATFTFLPTLLNGTTKIDGNYPAKYTIPIDKGQLAKSAALGVGSYFVKGLSIGYNAIEGAVKNEQDNRIKSGVEAAYEGSPLSYVEKGQHININKGEYFYLNFKVKEDEEDLPNYEYQELD